mgnify:CR=1 FL=1
MKDKTDKLKPGDIIVMNRFMGNTTEKEVMRLLLTHVTKREVRGHVLYCLGWPHKVGQTWAMRPDEYAHYPWRMA